MKAIKKMNYEITKIKRGHPQVAANMAVIAHHLGRKFTGDWYECSNCRSQLLDPCCKSCDSEDLTKVKGERQALQKAGVLERDYCEKCGGLGFLPEYDNELCDYCPL